MNINNHKYFLLFFLSILLLNCFSGSRSYKNTTYKSNNQIDTIDGYFFYEVNIRQKCYTAFDQTEQGNSMIFFDSLIYNKEISRLYVNGVFVFSYYTLMRPQDYMYGAMQNKKIVYNFFTAVEYLNHREDSVYKKTLYYDKTKILMYKKIYAKFIVGNLGKQRQLIPDMTDYKCCYSNTIKEINTFFIIDILDYKVF